MKFKRYITALRRYHRSRGFGIHSPFAFKFVLNVLRERLPYYAYEDFKELRKTISQHSNGIFKRRRIISHKNAKLLFRITNYFNPAHILQIGTSYGLSSASMLAVSSKTELYLCKPDANEFPATHDILSHYGNTVKLFPSFKNGIAAYNTTETAKKEPFILVNDIIAEEYNTILSLLYKVRSERGVIIIRNLSKNKHNFALWEALRDAAPTGMTFTNDKMAIIVASPKLPHQNFSLWF